MEPATPERLKLDKKRKGRASYRTCFRIIRQAPRADRSDQGRAAIARLRAPCAGARPQPIYRRCHASVYRCLKIVCAILLA